MPGVGDLLGNKYRVLAKLGEGGMGSVFSAENVVTGKHVAVKWMHPHVAANPDAAARLLREAQAASRLSHPSVVDVYDIVQDDKTLFLVMELLHGESLRAYLARNPHPKVTEFLTLLLPALQGVAAAHEKGVIHRDLKPDNIFLVSLPNGGVTAKVLDFGVAKFAASHGLTLTETGMALGTPLYMSLEQLRGDKDIDARTDVYAFGVMLYEAITGAMPYLASTLPELAIKVATTDPVPVKDVRPDLPTPLARIVDWSIARDRKQRMPDVPTLLRELEPFAREHSFRDQMTQQDRAVPRLGVQDAVAPPQLLAAQRPQPIAAALPAPAAVLPEPAVDTFTARELAAASTRSKRMRPIWLAALVLLAGGGLAFGLRQAPEPASPSQAHEVRPLPTPSPAAEVHDAPRALPPSAAATAQPTAAQASATQASATQASATQPSAAQASAAQPSTEVAKVAPADRAGAQAAPAETSPGQMLPGFDPSSSPRPVPPPGEAHALALPGKVAPVPARAKRAEPASTKTFTQPTAAAASKKPAAVIAPTARKSAADLLAF